MHADWRFTRVSRMESPVSSVAIAALRCGNRGAQRGASYTRVAPVALVTRAFGLQVRWGAKRILALYVRSLVRRGVLFLPVRSASDNRQSRRAFSSPRVGVVRRVTAGGGCSPDESSRERLDDYPE